MNKQQRVQFEADAVAVAERIKADLLAVIDAHLRALSETSSAKFARFAALEGARAMMATLLTHVLAEDDNRETRVICASSVSTLDAIVTPPRLH